MRKEVKAGESRAFEGRAGVTKAGRGQLSSCRLKSVLRPAPGKRTRGERACGRQEGPSRAVNLSLMGEVGGGGGGGSIKFWKGVIRATLTEVHHVRSYTLRLFLFQSK